MKFKRIELGIKIGALADEAQRIRSKERTILLQAARKRVNALVEHKGIDEANGLPEEALAELRRRLAPAAQRGAGDPVWVVDRIARKVIRKYLRAGLTKDEILALPGVKRSLRLLPIYDSLRMHRKGPVRHEARHAQLALAFLRDKPYGKTEDKPNSYPQWDKVADIAKRFSQEDARHLMQKFEEWRQEAHSFIRGREIMSRVKFQQELYRV